MEAWCDPPKRRPRRWLALAALPLLFFCTTEEVRPNFLLILTDDMGVQLGAYGDLHATTPEIDKLAGEDS